MTEFTYNIAKAYTQNKTRHCNSKKKQYKKANE